MIWKQNPFTGGEIGPKMQTTRQIIELKVSFISWNMANLNNYKNEKRKQNKPKFRLRGEQTRKTNDKDRATLGMENTWT